MSNPDDASVAEELKAHHAIMIADLDRLTGGLLTAALDGGDAAAAKAELEQWIARFLVPHAAEEEATSYAAAAHLPEGGPLITSMLAEHVLIRHIAAQLSAAENPVEAGAYGRSLFDIFDSHQSKENDIILPMLVASDAVSLAEVMGGHLHDHGHDHGHEPDHDHGH